MAGVKARKLKRDGSSPASAAVCSNAPVAERRRHVVPQIAQDECPGGSRIRDRSPARVEPAGLTETRPAKVGLLLFAPPHPIPAWTVAGITGCRNFTISREQVRAGIIFTGRRNGDLAVQTCHTATDVNLANVSVRLGGIAVEGVDFRSFIGLFSRPIEQDEVHDARDGIRAVNGRSAIFQYFRRGKGPQSGEH